MAPGDGIRRNVAKISQAERDAFINALQQLDMSKLYPDGVSYWDKQDAIHQATHVHGGPAFLPWHRELCNRFEALLREVDPSLSLHYWDWTTDPRASDNGMGGVTNLFSNTFMGSASGRAGGPLETFDNGGVFAGSRDDTGNPADPPQEITRSLQPGAPGISADNVIITSADGSPQADQFPIFRGSLEGAHNSVHGYIGGTIGSGHSAFEDPFVFLLHSNVDRLFAMWQTVPGQSWRMDPNQLYGTESNSAGNNGILTDMEPWAGASGLRPWAPPENQQVVKNSRHSTVVRPPCYDTLPVSIELQKPGMGMPLTFLDIPAGETTVRAAVFDITACMNLTFEIASGPGAGFGTPLGVSTTTVPDNSLKAQAHLWISYTGTAPGDIASGSVTIHCVETNQQWTIPITANTIQRPTVASILVLDKSASMEWDSGIPGNRRLDILKIAAPIFADVMPDLDAIGIVSFDHDAYPVMLVTPAGVPIFGAGRVTAKAAIAAHAANPAGNTAIGDGVELAHNTLIPVAGYDHKAIVVFTDGQETASKYIADVAGLINERVFAIGLGTADQLNPIALNSLVNSSGGYLLMTGSLGPGDIFRLSKYYLQILAGITNTAIVTDPESSVLPKQIHRIPFVLTEADFGSDVILLSPAPWAYDFALETPDGTVIDQAASAGITGMMYVAGSQVHYYRMNLPVPVGAVGAHAGVWHALLSVDEGNFKEYLTMLRRKEDQRGFQQALAHGVPYSLSVHARSNLRMQASVVQASQAPGAVLTLRALLTEYSLPVTGRARISAGIESPDGTSNTLELAEVAPGVFEGKMAADIPGVYRFLFHAAGKTLHGQPFTRDELRTVGVWKGGDESPPSGQTDPHTRAEQICRLIDCLLDKEVLGAHLAERNIDPEAVRRCLRRFCDERLAVSETRQPQLGAVSPALLELSRLMDSPQAGHIISTLAEAIRTAGVK